jgi:hypothetical protein
MSQFSRPIAWVYSATALLVALVALFNVFPAARKAWCDSAYLFCRFDIAKAATESISVVGAPTNDRRVCYDARLPFSRLTNMTFEPDVRDQIYYKGESTPKEGVAGVGYTVVENTAKRYCVKIWAQRVNDTYFPNLSGHIEGIEWITIF